MKISLQICMWFLFIFARDVCDAEYVSRDAWTGPGMPATASERMALKQTPTDADSSASGAAKRHPDAEA